MSCTASIMPIRLIIEPHLVPCYTLAELLAQCEPSAPLTSEYQAWLEEEPTGREVT